MKINTAKAKGCCLCLLCVFTLVAGCAKKNGSASDSLAAQSEREFADGDNPRVLQAVERFARDYRQAMLGTVENGGDDEAYFSREYLVRSGSRSRQKGGKADSSVLISTARTALGTPYVRGGTDRGGFDCSGFVQWTFNHVGVKLPRTAREQSQVGRPIRNVDDLKVGDIVAFRHPKRGYHTGIYVGEGKFIHSPRKRNVVRINSLDDPYFNRTFLGARRVNVTTNEADMEAAQKMVASFEAEKHTKKYQTMAAADSPRKKGKAVRRTARGAKSKRNAAVRVVADRGDVRKAQVGKSSKIRKSDVKKSQSSKVKGKAVSGKKKITKTAEKSSKKRGNSKYQAVAKRS